MIEEEPIIEEEPVVAAPAPEPKPVTTGLNRTDEETRMPKEAPQAKGLDEVFGKVDGATSVTLFGTESNLYYTILYASFLSTSITTVKVFCYFFKQTIRI